MPKSLYFPSPEALEGDGAPPCSSPDTIILSGTCMRLEISAMYRALSIGSTLASPMAPF